MNRLVLATLLVGCLFWPRVASPMEIPQFDRMAKEDQRDYVIFLVKRAQELLIEEGHEDLAVKIAVLFKKIPAGETQSLGKAQFETRLASARPWSTKINFEVESVLFETLHKQGIALPPTFYKHFRDATRNRVFYQHPKLIAPK